MENNYNSMRESHIARALTLKSKLNTAIAAFSKREKTVFIILVIILVISTLSIIQGINKYFMVNVPMYGGSVSEGIIGTPRFVNPILAFTDADQDLVTLVYSGLMRKDENGNLIPDLALKYEVSPNGLEYTFTLKDNIYFHDKKPVTVDDILFTINNIKDPIIKSPERSNWEGVTATKIDEKTIKFVLRQPYASFLENTTLGIIPAHLWINSPLELNSINTNPIGSGPYMIENVEKESSGIVNAYELKRFDKFALGKPYIENIKLRFYSNEENLIKGLKDGEIKQISSITPLAALALKEKGYHVEDALLPRVFGLFFNQNVNQLFVDKSVVAAINQAIDKDRIVREVLGGYGVVINDPIPPGIISNIDENKNKTLPRDEVLKKVEENLAKNGWKKNSEGFLEKSVKDKNKTTTTPLSFSISTSNAPELVKAALLIKQDLEAVGMKVEIKTFEVGNLNQDVIRPRKYDALLFGQIINNESDLFAFWHSSQRKDPGFNVSMYTNAKVDKILETAFVVINKNERLSKYVQFEEEIRKDMPAVFLYTPEFVYVVEENLKGTEMDYITSPSNRFGDVYKWYTEEDSVWKIFAK